MKSSQISKIKNTSFPSDTKLKITFKCKNMFCETIVFKWDIVTIHSCLLHTIPRMLSTSFAVPLSVKDTFVVPLWSQILCWSQWYISKQLSEFFESILSKFQCGFRKGYGAQHCLLMMLETWKEATDNNKAFGALLTDLSKAFDCLSHDSLIAKLHAYVLI